MVSKTLVLPDEWQLYATEPFQRERLVEDTLAFPLELPQVAGVWMLLLEQTMRTQHFDRFQGAERTGRSPQAGLPDLVKKIDSGEGVKRGPAESAMTKY